MILYLLLSIAGGIVLYTIVRILFNHKFPKPPKELLELKRKVDEATASGNWYDDSDIYMLDDAMARAEMEKPGSTLLLYFDPKIIMIVGGMVVSFIVNGWIMGIFPICFWTILGLVLGFSFLLSFFLLWFISRPKKARGTL